MPRIATYPFTGSAIFYWDIAARPDPDKPGETIGAPPPPLDNVPNRVGEDPHGAPAESRTGSPRSRTSCRTDGAVLNLCGPKPCYGGGWTGLRIAGDGTGAARRL